MIWDTHSAFIDSANGTIFCTQFFPREPQAVVLLVPPLGQLYYRCHLLYRQIAQRLAKQGQAVYRMDFRGTGDASGDFEQINQQTLIDDVQSGYNSIRLRFPNLPLWIVATDWSAVPVLQFCAQHSASMKLWGLILVEPQLQGAAYWQQQLQWQQAIIKEPLRFRHPRELTAEPDQVEIAGHCYAKDWITQIQATDASSCWQRIVTKHRVCMASYECLMPIKNYLSVQANPRIQDHCIELQPPPAWWQADKLDQSVQHAQWLQSVAELIQQLR